MNLLDKKKLIAWYDFQAPLYHFWRDNYNSPLVQRVVKLLDGSSQIKILDAGCGSGLFTVGIALSRPDCIIEGVDCSAGLNCIGKKQADNLALQNVRFNDGDVESLQFADYEFDAAVAAGLFPNLNEPRLTLLEIFRVLKTGGRFVVVEFDRSSMGCRTRIFFRIMIFSYRLFTLIFRQFRFAEKWNIEASTIDELKLLSDLHDAGFVVEDVLRENEHLIFSCRKI